MSEGEAEGGDLAGRRERRRAWLAAVEGSGAERGGGRGRGGALARAQSALQGGASPLDLDRAEALLARCEALGVQVIPYADPQYPPLLRLIPSPPLTLYALGDLTPALQRPLVACVGTRSPSGWGLSAARAAAGVCVAEGFGVVSGLALGIDAAAHAATLDAGGYTVAVLGGALGCPSPAAQRPLARRILAQGGALLSELPPDAPVSASSLVARDRLQSGLSVGVFVAESSREGGSMHTARFAQAQGRAVWVPSPPRGEGLDAAVGGLWALLEGGARALGGPLELCAAAGEARAGWAGLSAAGRALSAAGEEVQGELF